MADTSLPFFLNAKQGRLTREYRINNHCKTKCGVQNHVQRWETLHVRFPNLSSHLELNMTASYHPHPWLVLELLFWTVVFSNIFGFNDWFLTQPFFSWPQNTEIFTIWLFNLAHFWIFFRGIKTQFLGLLWDRNTNFPHFYLKIVTSGSQGKRGICKAPQGGRGVFKTPLKTTLILCLNPSQKPHLLNKV